MYGLAYVLISSKFSSLQAELDQTLAPFMRGGDAEFPREKLAFHDATGALTRLHRTRFRYNSDGSLTWLDPADASYDLSLANLKEHMLACALDRFEGTFAEIEPDFDAFVRRLTRFRARDATTGRYGDWLNPIGYWDWWELGGRFNGVITGERRPAGLAQAISSGPSRGRAVMGNLGAALGAPGESEQAEIEANVELVETLKAAAERKERHSVPTALSFFRSAVVRTRTAGWIASPGTRSGVAHAHFSVLRPTRTTPVSSAPRMNAFPITPRRAWHFIFDREASSARSETAISCGVTQDVTQLSLSNVARNLADTSARGGMHSNSEMRVFYEVFLGVKKEIAVWIAQGAGKTLQQMKPSSLVGIEDVLRRY